MSAPRAWAAPLAAVVAYLVVAVLAYWPVEPFSATKLVGCACGDQVQEVWFLAWVAHALTHGVSPFFTSALNHPYGVNLADNTSMPLLGLLASPITLVRGPVAAYNAMMRLAFVASATSMCFVTRRFTSRWFPAFLAGLLYGFSPYMVGEGNGHLFLLFVPLPPLIALAVVELCRVERSRARPWGLLLGGLAAAQYLVSSEILATTALFCAMGVVVAAILRPAPARGQVLTLLAGVGWALVLFVPIVGYPVYEFLDGPRHVVGPPQPSSALAPYRGDLLGPVVPTVEQWLGPASWKAVGTSFAAGNVGENGAYLGVPLVVVLLYGLARFGLARFGLARFGLARFRRELLVVAAGAVGLCCYVLSLGARLTVDGHATSVRMPFDLLTKLPFFQGLLSARFALYVQLCAAFVLAVATDRLLAGAAFWPGARRARDGASRWAARGFPRQAAIGTVAAAVLVPLVPHFPYASAPADVPAYVTGGAVRAVPSGSAVLTYPYDFSPNNEAMLWQALSGMRFSIVGGEVTRPGPDGTGTSAVYPLAPTELQNLFRVGLAGSAANVPAPPLTRLGLERVREFFSRWDIGTVLVDPTIGADPDLVVHYLTVALRRPPEHVGGLDVWYLHRGG